MVALSQRVAEPTGPTTWAPLARAALVVVAAVGLLGPSTWIHGLGIGDTGLHILGFAGLVGAWRITAGSAWHPVTVACGFALLAPAAEWAQMAVPARSFVWAEAGYNTVGVVLGLAVVALGDWLGRHLPAWLAGVRYSRLAHALGWAPTPKDP